MSTFNAGPAGGKAPSGLTAADIREMMASARQTIAERKLQLVSKEKGDKNGNDRNQNYDAETLAKMHRAAELQAQIAERLKSGVLSDIKSTDETKKMKDAPNVIFDDQGKTIDAMTGEEIQLTHHTPTLKANLNAKRAQNFKEALETTAIQKKVPKTTLTSAYFDPRLSYASLDELNVMSVVNESWITNLIEHPVKMAAPKDLCKKPEIPLLLTKKERKKLRRQNRLEAQKERQEKVRLGLMPPPEPKVRLANLMRVLGSDAVQDPSKVEAYVRSQMESRKRAHESANSARKLTREQARYKRIKKIREDTSTIVHVAVYRVLDFNNPSHRFKVETNANQLLMTGIAILQSDCNVVVVEGGAKQQRKFERLMLNRIRWSEGKRGSSSTVQQPTTSSDSSSAKGCQIMWKGTVAQRAFDKLKFRACPTELFARELFRKRDVEHYWDLAYSKAVLESNSNL